MALGDGWGAGDREWTQSTQGGPPCVPIDCNPLARLPRDPSGRPVGIAADPGFAALLEAAGKIQSYLGTLAQPAGGASFQQLPPHQGVPFRAKPLTGITRAVLNCATAAPGFMSANAVAMALALGLPGPTLSVLPPTTGIGGQQLLVNFTTPLGFRAVLTHVGVETSDARKNSVLFTVVIGAPPTQVGNTMQGGSALIDPSPLAEVSTLTNPVPMPANVTQNTTIQIWARNLDGDAPVYVEGQLWGWIYPALQQSDSLASSLSGAPCAPSGTDRTDAPTCGTR